jgi:hypothetical protein
MEVSEQFLFPAVLSPKKETRVLTGQEVLWDPEKVWTRWWRDKSLTSPRIELQFSDRPARSLDVDVKGPWTCAFVISSVEACVMMCERWFQQDSLNKRETADDMTS